jgi:drug/metabolite transporter (DMT)-like permease
MPIPGAGPDGRSWALLFALAILWSASFIFIKIAGAEIPAFTLVLVRVAMAALVLHAIVLATARRYPKQPAMLFRYAIMGLINNVVPFVLIVYATARLGAGTASILNATAPIFALVIAHFVTADERMTPVRTAGILLGFGGVAALAGPQASAGLTGDLWAVGAMLVACFFYGLSAIYGRGFAGIDATMSATCQLTASTLLLLPLAVVIDRPWVLASPGWAAILSTVALAVLSTALAYILYYALIARAGATNTILVTLLIPVGGVFLGWAVLDEVLAAGEAAGMLLIGLGLVVVDGRALGFLRAGSR